jgi:hypothetical protein
MVKVYLKMCACLLNREGGSTLNKNITFIILDICVSLIFMLIFQLIFHRTVSWILYS